MDTMAKYYGSIPICNHDEEEPTDYTSSSTSCSNNDRMSLPSHYLLSTRSNHDGGNGTPGMRRRTSLFTAADVRTQVRRFSEAVFVLPGRDVSVREMGGKATLLSEVVNITKSIAGCAVLSLPSGIAIFADSPTGLLAAALCIVVLSAVFAFFCWLIAKICNMTLSATYREAWQNTVGDDGSLAVAIANVVFVGMANLICAAILSQNAALTLQGALNMPVSRVSCLLVITLFILLPLCLLKSLHYLAKFAVVGLVADVVTAICMMIRYLDGSYQAPDGIYYQDLPPHLQPSFGTRNEAFSPKILPFCCIVSASLVMHFNAPRFYTELRQPTLQRFGQAVGLSFGVSSLFYLVIASVGFMTFGANADGLILNNYSPYDPLATVSRVMVFLSVMLLYPILFVGLRDGVIDVLEIPASRQTASNLNVLTILILTILTILSVWVTDLGLMNAIGGGTLATAIVFVIPTIMYRRAVHNLEQDHPDEADKERRRVQVTTILMVLGILLGVVGVYESLKASSSSSPSNPMQG